MTRRRQGTFGSGWQRESEVFAWGRITGQLGVWMRGDAGLGNGHEIQSVYWMPRSLPQMRRKWSRGWMPRISAQKNQRRSGLDISKDVYAYGIIDYADIKKCRALD